MNIFLLVCCSIILVSLAKPQRPIQRISASNPQDATILQYDNDNIGLGAYNFAYQTSDGISRQETAELKNAGSENEALVVRGSYSYVGPDGVTYTVNYIADENGFQPQGQHIPSND